jgi:Protein of unknown function (DUF2842)
MSPRLRKLIGLFGILGFLAAYVVLAVTVGERVPDHWAARLAFYGLAGLVWGLPLFPLIRWMSRDR